MTDLVSLLLTGDQNVGRLAEPADLERAATEIVQFAIKRDIDWLIPASSTAERVFGAILLMEGGSRFSATRSFEAAPAIVFDINMASGTVLARATQRARSSGATTVVGAVLYRLSDVGPSATDCNLDELAVLRPTPEQADENHPEQLEFSGLSG